MTKKHNSKAAVLTEIMLAVFRVNGRLLEKGDQLVAPLGLTSARWQVLGAVTRAGKPITAPQVAEAMGMTRQGAQKQLNKMGKEGFFEIRSNPRHARSPLYAPTLKANKTIDETMALNALWANALAANLALADIKNTLQILNTIYELLDSPVPTKGAKK
jgi:DNA-binding MarR family transcriptional regulator